MSKRVSEVMSQGVVVVHENDNLASVFDLFEEKHISGVPVKNSFGEYVGVLSKTDLVSHSLVEKIRGSRTLDTLVVKDFMNPSPPITIEETDSMDVAVDLMAEKRVHRLFVVNAAGEMVGVVSTFDVVKLMSKIFMAYL